MGTLHIRQAFVSTHKKKLILGTHVSKIKLQFFSHSVNLKYLQEDGTVTMEEATGRNSRIGAYSYIGDDGKTYTVKYEVKISFIPS